MEISNRSIGLLVATGMIAALAVRTESANSQDLGSNYPSGAQVASEAATPTGAGQATLNMVSQTPPVSYNLGTRGIPTPSNSAGPQIPDQNTANDQTSQSAQAPYVRPDSSAYRIPTDDTAYWGDDEPLNQPGDFTDRELFDRYISFLSDNDRDQFRVVWVAMSPEERQSFLDSLR